MDSQTTRVEGCGCLSVCMFCWLYSLVFLSFEA